MKLGKLVLAVSFPAFLAAASMPASAADIVYPIDDPVYAPVPMALLGDLKLGLGFSHVDTSYSTDDDDDETFMDVLGEGRANVPLNGGAMQLQLDVGAYGALQDGYGSSSAAFQGHLWHMRDAYAYGLFGGLQLAGYGPAIWSIGAEAEHYYGNATLGAYAAYRFSSSEDDISIFQVNGYLEHYVNPDHKVGIELGYTTYDSDGPFDVDSWEILVSGEKRVSGTPFSYWAEAGYSD